MRVGEHADLAVVGSGGAAFAAAIRASDLGARVVMIERGTIGGTCVNIGCIPSKALIRAGETRRRAERHAFAGIPTAAGPADLTAAAAQKDQLVGELRQTKYVDLLDAYGIELARGEARFLDPDTLTVGGRTFAPEHILLATGARPALPPIPGLAEADPLTSTSALDLGRVPPRLVVIGGGYIALELGQLFAHLGSSVTILARSTVMRHEEPAVADTITRILSADGVRVLTDARVGCVDQSDAGVRISVITPSGEEAVEADRVLVATGRQPNSDRLDLAAGGVTTDEQGAIRTGADLRTSNPRVFAAGDVVSGAPKFVYVAARMGAAAAQNALAGSRDEIDYAALPRVTFTTPQIAAAGFAEAEAKRRGIDCSCRTLPLSAVPRALVNHDTDGFIKLVMERETRRLIGATAVADGAGDVIQAAVYAIQFGLTIDQLATTWAPYLTVSEGLKLAAQVFDRDVSKLSCCAA
jgi:mercuric reductase